MVDEEAVRAKLRKLQSTTDQRRRERALRRALTQEVAAELGIPEDEADIICNW